MARGAKTPEEKAAFAEKMKAARAEKAAEKAAAEKEAQEKKADAQPENATTKEPSETNESQSAEIELLKKQVESLMAQLQTKQTTQVINVMQDTEKVILRWQAEVADDNTEIFGPNGMYGQVTGKTGKVIVPKSEWSRFYTDSVRWRIDNRWLIVLSGLTDDEREIYRCNYRKGEVLDEQAFTKLVEMRDGLLDIFSDLCIPNQEFVAQRFIQAWYDGIITSDDRQLITKLNQMSRAAYEKAGIPASDYRAKGAFMPLIEWMNAKEVQ
jgi:flagellar biosynthesis GTPase FlhF|nr:MAG TPA: hypothetical protein [Caudoviricetes sp.]